MQNTLSRPLSRHCLFSIQANACHYTNASGSSKFQKSVPNLFNDKPQSEGSELLTWQEVIDKAVELGYRGPTDVLNNRAKAWSFEYLRVKGLRIIIKTKNA